MLSLLAIIMIIMAKVSWGDKQQDYDELVNRAEETYPFKMTTMVTSYYGGMFHGRKTANGETYDQYALTCAHKTLPFGTELLVINPDNGARVILRVNDRGPYIEGRQLDVSYGAALKLGMIKKGIITSQVIIARR